MSKKIISFTLLSASLLFSLTTLEAMKFRGLLKTPRALLAKRLALPALAAAGGTYALAEKQQKPLMVTEDEEIAFRDLVLDRIQKLNKEDKEESASSKEFSVKDSSKKLTAAEIAEKNLNIMAFFSKHYVGPCPEKVRSIIAHFHFYYKSPKKHTFANTFLLHGIPGTGKTYLAEELSHILEVPLLACNATLFIDKYSGESSKKIRNFFKIIKERKTPLIIFIDEIDSIALKRDNISGGEYRSALTMLLTEIQDITFQNNVVLLVATNNLDSLDPAVTSRFTGQKIELKKISEKKDFITLFERSLEENQRTEATAKEAEEIYNLTQDYISNPLWKYKYSLRQLKRIVPLALDHIYTEKTLNNNEVNFSVAIKEAIKEVYKE